MLMLCMFQHVCSEQCHERMRVTLMGSLYLSASHALDPKISHPITQPSLSGFARSWARLSTRRFRRGRASRRSSSRQASRPTWATTTSPTWSAPRACSTSAAPTKVQASPAQGGDGVSANFATTSLGKPRLGCLKR